ncbi:hypothetical protein CDAR_377241 [Caerostris darwini]|uniref:Uncharacterized protein n=1 Tax=Caerostris darwini TaxID=1538125 RepID=A0AAV4PFD7_9ARAC|nr:hypothetical protein CDAR_377241 [Caerostris darwini]
MNLPPGISENREEEFSLRPKDHDREEGIEVGVECPTDAPDDPSKIVLLLDDTRRTFINLSAVCDQSSPGISENGEEEFLLQPKDYDREEGVEPKKILTVTEEGMMVTKLVLLLDYTWKGLINVSAVCEESSSGISENDGEEEFLLQPKNYDREEGIEVGVGCR